MNWHVYSIHPIDWGWSNLKTISQTLGELANGDLSDVQNKIPNDIEAQTIDKFLSDWKIAKERAKEFGWEGDFRDEPCTFWLPAEQFFEYGFVFKQENNGKTYVISPYPLNWLDSLTNR